MIVALLCASVLSLVPISVPARDQATAHGQSAVFYKGDLVLGGGIIE